MSQSLGKRKERDDEQGAEAKPHGSTLFVSNLPYSATSTDLKTLFSDIGPVRTAFVVLDHDKGSSKGVGYVTFAIREDAQLAYDNVNSGEGLALDGRKLRVDWAGSKPHKDKDHQLSTSPSKHESTSSKSQTHPHKTTQSQSNSSRPPNPTDPLAIRTILISGLPRGLSSKALWKKMRKYPGAEKVEWLSGDGTSAHVVFATPAQAQAAVGKLHAHVFKGALLSVALKKRVDTVVKAKTKAGAGEKGKQAGASPSRASRLIVRNLPFDVTEQDLRAVFLPYGPIYSIHIPTAEAKTEVKKEEEEEGDEAGSRQHQHPTNAKPRGKGYAFVWMLSRKDAERALEGANGTRIRAGMADGLVRDKQKKKKQRREEAKLKQREKERKARMAAEKAKSKGKEGAEIKEEEGEEDQRSASASESESEEEEEEEDEDTTGERIIAVDWALSKDKWEEAKAKLLEAQVEGEEAEDESGSGSDGGEDENDEADSHIGVHDGDSDDESGSEPSDDEGMDVDEDEEEEKPGRPQLPATDVGTTLFVRNVPFEATEDELRTVFRAFGPLRYARITMDHDTGRSRGTGFVCFWKKEDADKAIEQSEILKQETTGGAALPTPKRNPFKLPSLLTPDPSASVAKNLVLHGRTLDVTRAVTRDEAAKLKEIGERQREKADKRNLYLLREGIILPNTPAAEGLSPADLEKRTQSFNARKALLRSNPSLYVSRTRLSIRQIPLFVTERMLKRLGIHAVRAFEAEVKEGVRAPLTADELAEPLPDPHADEAADEVAVKDKGKDKSKGKFGKSGRSTGVKQAKIVRQQDRVDAVTGKGRSKGYGFLEMEKHADALRVLRWANNNTAVNKLFEQWWREELQLLLEVEKKKAKKDEARVERIKTELEQGAQRKSKGTLIVEFSIENVQVVKRRAALQEERRRSATPTGDRKQKVSKRPAAPSIKKEPTQQDGHPHKKPRLSEESVPAKQEKSAAKQEKAGTKIGSIIGRKRKERRAKKKA